MPWRVRMTRSPPRIRGPGSVAALIVTEAAAFLGDGATRGYILGLHLTATLCIVLAAVVLGVPWLYAPAAVAGLGGLLLARGIARTRGAALNAYLARSAALELLTGAGLAAVLMLADR